MKYCFRMSRDALLKGLGQKPRLHHYAALPMNSSREENSLDRVAPQSAKSSLSLPLSGAGDASGRTSVLSGEKPPTSKSSSPDSTALLISSPSEDHWNEALLQEAAARAPPQQGTWGPRSIPHPPSACMQQGEKAALSLTYPASSLLSKRSEESAAPPVPSAEARMDACAAPDAAPDRTQQQQQQQQEEEEEAACRRQGSPRAEPAGTFLEAFHRRQRNRVSSELRSRNEALLTLKHWRGGRGGPSAASGGPRRPPHDAAARRRVVGEMVALFSSLSLSKQQRAAVSCKQAISQLQQQRKQLAELISRVRLSGGAPKARGALVKARSFQLQMQQQGQRTAAQQRRLPPHLLLPLPSFTSRVDRQGEHKQETDSWRRLLKRVRPAPRRASLPPSVGRHRAFQLRLNPHASSAAAAAAAGGAAGRLCVSGGLHTHKGRAGLGEAGSAAAASARAAETAAHDAAAAAAADFAEGVERFSSRHRRASAGSRRGPLACLWPAPQQSAKEQVGELLQQAEVVCCAALADAPSADRACVLESMQTLAKALSFQMAQQQQRLEVAALLERRRPHTWGVSTAAVLGALAAASDAAASGEFAVRQIEEASGRLLPKPGCTDTSAARQTLDGRRQHDLLRLPLAANSLLEERWAEELQSSPGGTASSRRGNESVAPSASELGEEDLNSLFDAETDCEYLLGRQLLPYERVLLKYRMLRRSTGLLPGSSPQTAEAQLVDQLLRAVEDGCTPAGDLLGGEEEAADLWGFWGSKGESDAAQVDQLLGLVGELQQADAEQHSLLQNSLLASAHPMSTEERMLRSFFDGKELSELADSELGTSSQPAGGESQGNSKETRGQNGGKGEKTENNQTFPTAERLYRAHFLLGPWRNSFHPMPKEQKQ
ncbi:hypothetical protein Efla_006412 [Eimeria flavescens]